MATAQWLDLEENWVELPGRCLSESEPLAQSKILPTRQTNSLEQEG